MSGVAATGSASRRSSNTTGRVDSKRAPVVHDSEDSDGGQETASQRHARQTSDGVEVTPHRSPTKTAASTARKSTASRRTTRIAEENDENDATNVASASGSAAPETPTASSTKKRRLSKSGRASVAAEPEANGEEEDEEEDDATPPPPSTAAVNGRKSKTPASARRVNEDDEDEAEVVLDGSENEAEEKKAIKKQAKLVRDPKDGYVMGSVVRIKCVNFLTYSNAECFPGASLNMIIGPNGAGKSTVAAAIAIGLGYPPKVMGRSSHLKNFVRENETDGHVEIELKGKPGKKNMVIKRYLNAQDNTSKFEINGKTASKEAVTEAVADLNVNVNNLCSFLPQDRVKEFSQLTGSQLLKETQRVVDPQLLVRQEQLVKMKERYAKASKSLDKDADELKEKDRKLSGMSKDVEKYQKRKEIEGQLLVQEVCLPYMQYIEAKEKHDKAKRTKNQAQEKIAQLTEQNAPLQAQKSELAMLIKETDRRFKQITKRYNEATRAQTNIEGSIQRNEGDVDKLRDQLKQLKKAEMDRKKLLSDTEAQIKKLEKEIAEGPPEGVPPELAQKLREVIERCRAMVAEITEINNQHNNVHGEIDNANMEKKRVQLSLDSLNDVFKRREEQCMREDAKLWAGTKWARQNRQQFRGRVFDPVRLLVSVKDKKYAKHAEAAINYGTFKTVLSRNHEDYEKLSATFTKFPSQNGPVNLKVNLAVLAAETTLESFPPPCSREELHDLGFDAFVLDLIEGPPEILAFLCQDANVHRIPVAFNNGERINHERVKHPDCPIKRYITNTTVTNIIFSRYGNREAIVQDTAIRDPRLFSETMDQNKKRDLELRMAEIDDQISGMQAARDAAFAKDQEMRDSFEVLKNERIKLEKQKKDIESLATLFEKKKVNLQANKRNLDKLLTQPSEEARRQKISKDLAKMAQKRLEAAFKLPVCARDMMKCQTAQARAACAGLQATASQQAIEQAISETSEEMTTAQEAFKAASTKFAAYKATAKEFWAEAERAKVNVPEEWMQDFQEQVETHRPSDEVAQMIANLKADLDMSKGISPAVIRRYEELKEQVDALKESVNEQRATVRQDGDKIHLMMQNWEGPVRKIVETVNNNFSRAMESFGCSGEVSLNSEDEDYSKWSVKIMVAFRDAEELTELTAQRQSGGERSLTTMTYLIALLELSQVPFSMVDEINQGMDGRAERAIHDTLVNAVCQRSDMGQYFLLTPKLLTGLTYAENMKILIVNNGDWLPDYLPLRSLINNRLESKNKGKARQ